MPRQERAAEFKEQVVEHAQAVGIVAAAQEPGPVEQTLRSRLMFAVAGKLTASGAEPVAPE